MKGQKRIAIITAIAIFVFSQACFANEFESTEQAEVSEGEICSLVDIGDGMDSFFKDETAGLFGESENAVVPVTPANTYVAGVKTDIRNLFSDTPGIAGYRSNNRSIASCRKNGIFKGKSTGTVVIEAFDSSKTTVSSVEIHVIKQKLIFPINPSSASFNAADYLSDPGFRPSEWVSSRPSVASINSATGLITIGSKGKTRISAIYHANGSTKKITGTLKIKNSQSGSFGLDGKHSITIETEKGNKTLKVKYLASESGKVFDMVNEYRQKNGLPAFERNAELQKAADLRAAELVKNYSHERPNGTMCVDIFPDYCAAAENIAMGQKSASAVMKSWKNSPGHNANLLHGICTCLAVSCVSYKGKKYWVQCFCEPWTDQTFRTEPLVYSIQVTTMI